MSDDHIIEDHEKAEEGIGAAGLSPSGLSPSGLSPSGPSVVLITGQSGAGHSTALKILEDQNYVTVDNLPLALVDQLVAIEVETERHQLAFCVDARTSGFDPAALTRLITNLKAKFADDVKIIHMSASQSELLRRYQITRRNHPLSHSHMIEEAIALDFDRMAEIRALSDLKIDTTSISPTMLRQTILGGVGVLGHRTLTIQSVSFSYKNGVPDTADYVFDMRFLRNPHWDPQLRSLTGEDEQVQKYIQDDRQFDDFCGHLTSLLRPILDRALSDGRTQLTIAFGCTGGKHRSVTMAHWFNQWAMAEGHDAKTRHRELITTA